MHSICAQPQDLSQHSYTYTVVHAVHSQGQHPVHTLPLLDSYYPEARHGDLHGIGGGQPWQQAALLCDVLHDHLLAKLGPLAAVPDGNAGAHLAGVNSPLCNQEPPCKPTDD